MGLYNYMRLDGDFLNYPGYFNEKDKFPLYGETQKDWEQTKCSLVGKLSLGNWENLYELSPAEKEKIRLWYYRKSDLTDTYASPFFLEITDIIESGDYSFYIKDGILQKVAVSILKYNFMHKEIPLYEYLAKEQKEIKP